jgi:hypothetical protein
MNRWPLDPHDLTAACKAARPAETRIAVCLREPGRMT